jgi:hypothetical protein
MNTRYIPRNPIEEKTHLESEAYALLSLFKLWKCKYKKIGTHYGVVLDIVAYMAAT